MAKYPNVTADGEIMLNALTGAIGDEAHQLIAEMQTLIDELAEKPQYAQYVKMAQLSLLDSNYTKLDQLLKLGILTVKGA